MSIQNSPSQLISSLPTLPLDNLTESQSETTQYCEDALLPSNNAFIPYSPKHQPPSEILLSAQIDIDSEGNNKIYIFGEESKLNSNEKEEEK